MPGPRLVKSVSVGCLIARSAAASRSPRRRGYRPLLDEVVRPPTGLGLPQPGDAEVLLAVDERERAEGPVARRVRVGPDDDLPVTRHFSGERASFGVPVSLCEDRS